MPNYRTNDTCHKRDEEIEQHQKTYENGQKSHGF